MSDVVTIQDRRAQTVRRLVSAKEACDILRCSKSHFYKVLIFERHIKVRIKHGRKTYFSREEVEGLSVSGWR